MLGLILIVSFGLLFAYFATLNTTPVSINFIFYKFENLPLYLAVLIPLATGLVIAALIYIFQSLSTGFSIGRKDSKLKAAEKEIAELTKKVHVLELENTKLKAETGGEVSDDDSI